MRKILLAVVAALLLATTAASVSWAVAARSHVAWPASCHKFGCVNDHLNTLDSRLRRLSNRVEHLRARNRLLLTCIVEYPVSKNTTYDNYAYGSDSNGDGNFDTNNFVSQPISDYLHQTQSGQSVDLWIVRDNCSPSVFNRPVAP
jgi:opacity protein-like surface antigen